MSRFLNSKTGSGGRRVAAPVLSLLDPAPAASILGTGQLGGTYGETVTASRAGSKIANLGSTVATVAENQAVVEPAGLLVERPHTNLITHSQTMANAVWASFGTFTATAAAGTAPDGTTTAARWNGAASSGVRQQSIAVTAAAYTFSFWAKSTSGSNQTTNMFVFDDHTVTSIATQTITVTSAWQRFVLQATFPSGATTGQCGISNTSGASDILVWQADLIASPYAQSPVLTTTAAAHTDNDRIALSPSNLPVAAGSCEFDFAPQWSTTAPSGGAALICTRNGTSVGNGGIEIFASSKTAVFLTMASTSSTSTVTSADLTWTAGQTYRFRAQWGGGNLHLYRDGVLVASLLDGSGWMPDKHDTLYIGKVWVDNFEADGYLSNIRFYA